MRNTSLYIHWPFCKSKCPYCDFNSHVADGIDGKAWLEAYIKELDYFKEYLMGGIITTIFFGGGTPSLAPDFVISGILEHIMQNYRVSDDIEITLEANPTSVEIEKFRAIRKAGVNRVSIGVQSLREERLKFLGRTHSSSEALKAIEAAAAIFPRFSFDLIYATPNLTAASWESELKEALSYGSKHLSLYQLTIEKGTKFYQDFKLNKFMLPSEGESVEQYILTHDVCKDRGLELYEISNYAVKGEECRHNLGYWHYRDYLGIGPGAHSRISRNGGREAIMMLHAPNTWLKSVSEKQNGIQNQSQLTAEEEISERLLMGLRLSDGVDINLVPNQQKLAPFIEHKLLFCKDDRVYTTMAGKLMLNYIIANLLS
jgi:putative oxygen-independent coproporphyrinogen III oxidase